MFTILILYPSLYYQVYKMNYIGLKNSKLNTFRLYYVHSQKKKEKDYIMFNFLYKSP